jgi:hypothetical protein
VHAAWVHSIAGLSQQEVGALVAAVRGLSSCYGPVQTAAAVKLQGITAHSPNPEAVAEALLELDAIQVGDKRGGVQQIQCVALAKLWHFRI